jgi:hypothetical protein
LKTAIIIALVILAIVGAIIGIRMWRATVTRAEYQPTPAFTGEDQTFARNAYEALYTADALDDSFEHHCYTPGVCSFLATARLEHKQALDRLRNVVSTIDPRFELPHGLKPLPEEREAFKKGTPGVKLDRRYLETFIQQHERAQAMLDQAVSIEDNPSLVRFADLWRADLDRHLDNAKQLMNELPDAASNMPLILFVGILSLLSSAFFRYIARPHWQEETNETA